MIAQIRQEPFKYLICQCVLKLQTHVKLICINDREMWFTEQFANKKTGFSQFHSRFIDKSLGKQGIQGIILWQEKYYLLINHCSFEVVIFDALLLKQALKRAFQ
ncbi:hypothetical protein ACO0LG_26145 [Undibacterium sp. Ji42W]|uniref:hypothetical protein n=1 Tax=Undibacterium sp. Ji42W TaxID=3413039 RepID=UPI003BF17B17